MRRVGHDRRFGGYCAISYGDDGVLSGGSRGDLDPALVLVVGLPVRSRGESRSRRQDRQARPPRRYRRRRRAGGGPVPPSMRLDARGVEQPEGGPVSGVLYIQRDDDPAARRAQRLVTDQRAAQAGVCSCDRTVACRPSRRPAGRCRGLPWPGAAAWPAAGTESSACCSAGGRPYRLRACGPTESPARSVIKRLMALNATFQCLQRCRCGRGRQTGTAYPRPGQTLNPGSVRRCSRRLD